MDADTVNDATAFLKTFFKLLYPTATEKELAYYVEGNALETINGTISFFRTCLSCTRLTARIWK